jgi:methionine synthase I (cobalamin-dependent)
MSQRRRTAIYFAALCLGSLIALCIFSCASQAGALRTATDAYASTVSTLAQYRQAGLISDQAAAKIETARQAARTALDVWRLAVQAGVSPAAPAADFQSAMIELSRLLLAAQSTPSPSP